MEPTSIADVEARAPADGRPPDGRRIAFDKAAHDAAVRAPMSGWIVVDGHAVRTATLILSGMVGALVLAVFIMGGYEHVWWAGLIALAGWPLLFVPRFVREDRRWRKENK
jgi:hypothetical protein